MSDTIYPKGIRTFNKNEKAPDFVLGSVIISLKEFGDWVKENPQLLTDYNGANQLRLQVLKKKDGGITLTVDTFKPEKKAEPKQSNTFTKEVDNDSLNDMPF